VCSANLAGGQVCGKKAKHVHEGQHLCGIHKRSAVIQQQQQQHLRERQQQQQQQRQRQQQQQQELPQHIIQAQRRNNDAAEAVIQADHAIQRARDRLRRRMQVVRREEALVAQAVQDHEAARARWLLEYNALQMAIDLHRENIQANQAINQPHVFVRDPVGDIDLRAFGQDAQSVHRSSVQSSTEAALDVILARPIGNGQNTVAEISHTFTTLKYKPLNRVLNELHKDIFERNLEAFGKSYKDVLDHVWATIRSNEHKDELVKRLHEELWEGRGMCSNGKMCRLLSVLQGFDDQVVAVVSRDAFQSKFATLANLPQDKREEAALVVFNDYGIPSAERQAWLEPLLEA